MNDLQNKPQFAITCDFFQVMLLGGVPESAPERFDIQGVFECRKTPIASRQFATSYEIYYEGKPFAIAMTHPRNTAILDAANIQLKVNNEQLYTDWLPVFKKLLQLSGWRVQNVTRVDIALDGPGHLDYYKRYMSGELVKVGRARTVEYFEGKRQLTGVDIGSKSSDKCITIYNKEKELERVNKGYIREFWNRAGIDTTRTVERLELKLKNTELARYEFADQNTGECEPFNWERLNDPKYMAGVMKLGLSKFYEFVRSNDPRKNMSEKHRVTYIDWERLNAAHLLKNEVIKSNEVYRVKLSVKTMFWIWLATG